MNLSDRLKPYQVAHQLVHRLEKYQVSEVPRPFRRMSWNDLRYWSLLLDEDDAGLLRSVGIDPDQYIPTPEEWFGKVGA